jgi:hypothetical protein
MNEMVQSQADNSVMHCGRQYVQGPYWEVDHSCIGRQAVGLFGIWIDSDIDYGDRSKFFRRVDGLTVVDGLNHLASFV